MTIAKRLTILLAVPLLALVGFGIFTRLQLSNIEERSRFVAETQIGSLATLGGLSRNFSELRVNLRNYLLTTNQAERATGRSGFDAGEAELGRLLRFYGDRLISDDQDRRHFNDFQISFREWVVNARRLMAQADEGRREEAVAALLNGSVAELCGHLSKGFGEWIQHNEALANSAGRGAVQAIGEVRWKMLVANSTAVLLTGLLGFLTFRRIVRPIQALEASVKTIAAGDYSKIVPFTQAADETGSLARSIDVLKQGAAEMEQQRWVKSNAARLTAQLQGATSLADFGQNLVSGLVPLLGGGVSALYLLEENSSRLKRIAAYGLNHGAKSVEEFGLGEGLVGQCARERKTITLTALPPAYLQIASGVGAAAPVQVVASPLLSKEELLGVLELATFRAFDAREQALLAEVLPVVGMSLEVLERNLRTQELLAQTQEQARQLEQQTEELVAQQDELTRQQEQLTASEERSRLILESSAEGIFGTDVEGRITFVNPAACRMLGFTAEELIGQPSHAAFHHHRPDGTVYPREECPMYAAYTTGKASRIDDEFLWCKDGTGLPVEYGATPILKDGKVVGSVISFTDITERKRNEQALAASEKKTRKILETCAEGFWLIDNDTVTVEVNEAMCRILKRSFQCLVSAAGGSFTIPPNVLLAMPPNNFGGLSFKPTVTSVDLPGSGLLAGHVSAEYQYFTLLSFK